MRRSKELMFSARPLRRSHIRIADLPAHLYRLHRGAASDFTLWEYIQPQSGRWQDPNNEYRVLYFSDSKLGAYVETLQDLRPNGVTVSGVVGIINDGGYPDFDFDMKTAIVEKLHNRRFSTFIPGHPDDVVVDLEESPTRTHLESIPNIATILLRRGVTTLKNGDFSAGDYALTNAISRAIYEDVATFSGLRCRSAEERDATNYTIFETGHDTNVPRATLIEFRTELSLHRHDLIAEVVHRLGVDLKAVS